VQVACCETGTTAWSSPCNQFTSKKQPPRWWHTATCNYLHFFWQSSYIGSTKQTATLLQKLSKREWGNLFSHPPHDTLPFERCRHKVMQTIILTCPLFQKRPLQHHRITKLPNYQSRATGPPTKEPSKAHGARR
jgi:hypothetical protein